MLFNSPEFLFAFFPLTLLGFTLLARQGRFGGIAALGVASLVFYAVWNPADLPVLLISIGVNYALGHLIHTAKSDSASRAALILGVAANLAALLYFKYAAYILGLVVEGESSSVTSSRGLPLGISFFTFTQIAYLADVRFRRTAPSEPASYFLFVTYFPHLIAGPVIHHHQFLSQVAQWRSRSGLTKESLAIGISLLTLGLAKKTMLADPLAAYSTPVFGLAAQGASPLLLEAWTGALCYSFQLYFDFSGYSDMALGLSRVFGIQMPVNFLSPYKAASLIDFWRRWHVSLSTFLRDYVYVPMGGNRHGTSRKYAHILLTMILGGIWHGAGNTFLLWGALHGFFLVANHMLAARNLPQLLPHFLRVAATFAIVTCCWVIFRAADVATAERVLRGMVGLNGISIPETFSDIIRILPETAWVSANGMFAGNPLLASQGTGRLMILLVVSGILVWLCPNTSQLFSRYRIALLPRPAEPSRITWMPTSLAAVLLGVLFAMAALAMNGTSEFLYFQF